MLIRSEQLTLNEASDILNESVYLEECETVLNPVSVPVLENTRLGICTVNYNDIYKICEDYSCFSDEALEAVAEASGVDVDTIAVAIDEADIILDPSIVDEFDAYVINPISENSMEYLLTESVIELFLEGDEEGYLDTDYMDLLVEGADCYTYLNEIGEKLIGADDKFVLPKVKYNTTKKGKTKWGDFQSDAEKEKFEKNQKYLKEKHAKIRAALYQRALEKQLDKSAVSTGTKKASEELKNSKEYQDASPEERQKMMTKFIRQNIETSNKRKTFNQKVLDRYGNNKGIKDFKYNITTSRTGADGVEKAAQTKMTAAQMLAAKQAGATFTKVGDSYIMNKPKDGGAGAPNSGVKSKDQYEQEQINQEIEQNKKLGSWNAAPRAKLKAKAMPKGATGKPLIPPKVQEEIKKAENTNDPGRISKIVASLRNFYKGFLQRAEQEHDSGKIAWYKNIARVILSYIDKLLAKLDKTKQD